MKRTFAAAVAAAAAAVTMTGVATADASPMKPLSIFVIAGQSNAAGWGRPVPAQQVTNPRVWDLTFGIKRATQPLGDAPGVGFAIPAAVELARHGLRVGLVQCGSGGLGIDSFQPGSEWLAECLARVRAATRYGTVRGVFFHQGETDSKTVPMADAWPAAFGRFVDAIRTATGDARLPVVFGLVRDFTACADCNLPAGPALRSLQRTIRLAQVAMVDADDLPVDGEHFTPDGYDRLGGRYAAAWLRLIRPSAAAAAR